MISCELFMSLGGDYCLGASEETHRGSRSESSGCRSCRITRRVSEGRDSPESHQKVRFMMCLPNCRVVFTPQVRPSFMLSSKRENLDNQLKCIAVLIFFFLF